MLGREEHSEMVSSMDDLIAQIRQAIENDDKEGALSLLDQYEQQAGEEESAEAEGLEGEGQEEAEEMGAPATMKKPGGMKQQMPDNVKKYMGM